MNIGAVDLAILAAYIAGTIALGLLLGRRAPSAEQYTLGGREQSWLLILLSIVATETSTVTFLSIPGFAYGRDLTWLQIAFGFLIGRLIVAYLLLPLFFRGAFVTAYEVLQRPLRRRGAAGGFGALRLDADAGRRAAPLPHRDRGAGDDRAGRSRSR